MVQKITWSRFLIIGINLLAIVTSAGCGKKTVEKRYVITYTYINNSNHEVFIHSWQTLNGTLYPFKYAIEKNKTLEQGIELMSGSISGLIFYADSLKISFDADMEKTYRKISVDNSEYNFLLVKNYSKVEISNGEEYTYTITEKDSENAK